MVHGCPALIHAFFCSDFFPHRGLRQAVSGVADLWESTIDAVKSLAVDVAISRALDRRVSALEGVRSSDQDICQVRSMLVFKNHLCSAGAPLVSYCVAWAAG